MALVHASRTGIPNDQDDEYRRPLLPEVEEYMRRYVMDEQDWEQVDDENCWGMNYTEPTTEIKDKIESIFYS